MFKKSKIKGSYLLLLAILFILSACQTTLPVFEQTAETDTKNSVCEDRQKTVNNTQYDYLVYANKMIDSMTKNRNVQEQLKRQRLKIYQQPVVNKTTDNIDISAINYAIKNRVIRSGQFIITNNRNNADYQLGGTITVNTNSANCDTGQRKFSLSLTGISKSVILWSEYKTLK